MGLGWESFQNKDFALVEPLLISLPPHYPKKINLFIVKKLKSQKAKFSFLAFTKINGILKTNLRLM